MSVFHILRELSHLLAVILLLGKICKSKNCTGISGKSQILSLSSSPPGIWTCSSTSYSTVRRWFFFSVPLSQCTWSMRSFENGWLWEWHILPGVSSGLVIGLCFLENSPGDPLDFLHLPGISGHPAPALHNQQDWRGWDHYFYYLVFLWLYLALYLANWIRRYQTEDLYG